MSRTHRLTPEFVEEIPRGITPGKLYISIAYATATHLCCCGCGSEVVTPLHPTRWRLIYDGETVSLAPSVGSWSLPCQSHYVITKNRVRWSARWSKDKIEAVRAGDQRATVDYFSPDDQSPTRAPRPLGPGSAGRARRLWRRLAARWTSVVRS